MENSNVEKIVKTNYDFVDKKSKNLQAKYLQTNKDKHV